MRGGVNPIIFVNWPKFAKKILTSYYNNIIVKITQKKYPPFQVKQSLQILSHK